MIAPLPINNQLKFHPQHKLDNLYDYLHLAEKLIIHIISPWDYHMSTKMIQDEDVISNIATDIMIADCQWNGGGSKYGFRKQAIRWTLLKQIQAFKRERKKPINLPNFDLLYHKTCYNNNPLLLLLKREQQTILNRLLVSKILTPREHRMLILRYFENQTLAQIGDVYEITRERVRQCINKALFKLQKCMKI